MKSKKDTVKTTLADRLDGVASLDGHVSIEHLGKILQAQNILLTPKRFAETRKKEHTPCSKKTDSKKNTP